jgi:hypothetical protein
MPPQENPPPEIGMEFVNPGNVGFRFVNPSKKVAMRDPYYAFLLFDLDGPRTHRFGPDFMFPEPLQIPARAEIDFLNPGDKKMPQAFSTFPAFQNIPSGHRIYGSVLIQCPYCKSKQYILFFKTNGDGWYAPISKDPGMELNALLNDTDAELAKRMPENKRKQIQMQ